MCSGRKFLKEAYHAIFQNDFQKAIEAFKKAIECEPNNASYYYKLSITYSRNGNIKEALNAAQKAHELEPTSQKYLYHFQIIHSKDLVLNAASRMKKGLLDDETIEMLKLSKKLDPLNTEAYILLGMLYGEKGLLTLALKQFTHVLNLDPFHQQVRSLRDYYMNKNQEGGK